ncbi:hypothetical protein [Rhodoplanes sp. Z2-YC6860]|uniref:hypothetical protein n=1 Tax=Rhodoplanes sp. Z2-YC6860 TaxID=674703 RepID=UPI00083729ED|nr:hypothetical protein [Rhodoplanes sp. Z2-YC6860]
MNVKACLPTFDELYLTVIAEWPGVLRLPVRNTGDGLVVDGLNDLHEALSSQWIGHELEVLMRTLHQTICCAIHAAFACEPVVVVAQLKPARGKFEASLRRTLIMPTWDDADRRTVRNYFNT